MNVKVKGYILGAVSAATYGTNPLFALPLYDEGMTADSVLFYRYLIAIPAIAFMLRYRRRSFAVSAGTGWKILAMGILMAFSSLFLFESYSYMDAGVASTLLFVYPLMVALLMTMFFHEKLTLLTGLCIAFALGGIWLLFKGEDGQTLSTFGTFIVMLSSLCYACYMIGVNRPGLREVPTLKLIFYCLVTGAIIFGIKIAATPTSSFAGPQHWYMWGCVLALAILPTVVSFVCTTEAVQCIGPTPTAILGALEPATAVIIGIFVFGEPLTSRDWIGLAMIVFAVSLVVAGGKISTILVHFRKLFPSLRHKKR